MPLARPSAANPGRDATDHDLRVLAVPGYHPARQRRSIATTRAIIAAAWEAMTEGPRVPLHVDAVLAGAGVSASSLYARFDSLDVLVDAIGLLALRLESGDDARPSEGGGSSIASATHATLAALTQPGTLPREVLAAGMWSDAYVDAHDRVRTNRLRHLAAAVATGDGAPGGVYGTTLTWLHLTSATAEQSWAIGGLAVPDTTLATLATRTVDLARHVFPSSRGVRPDATPESVDPVASTDLVTVRAPGSSRSKRPAEPGGPATADFLAAARAGLVTDGQHLSVDRIARSVHRSRTSLFDSVGTLGDALAAVARAEGIASVPTEVLRPTTADPPGTAVSRLVHRLRRWHDNQGIVGRRMLQAAGRHPEVAREVTAQTLASAERLASWYSPRLTVDGDRARLLFLLVLAAEQHQLVWGVQPRQVGGPDALAALLAGVVDASA